MLHLCNMTLLAAHHMEDVNFFIQSTTARKYHGVIFFHSPMSFHWLIQSMLHFDFTWLYEWENSVLSHWGNQSRSNWGQGWHQNKPHIHHKFWIHFASMHSLFLQPTLMENKILSEDFKDLCLLDSVNHNVVSTITLSIAIRTHLQSSVHFSQQWHGFWCSLTESMEATC